MYGAKGGLEPHKRDWVSWKQIMLHFVLLNSNVPNEKELATLRVKLTEAGEAQCIGKEAFKKVSSNFH